jgi:hypothetical protein
MSEQIYIAKIKLLKEALADIQKRYSHIFIQKAGSFHRSIPGILNQCFFGIKDGKPIFRFFHDAGLPDQIREESNCAFDQLSTPTNTPLSVFIYFPINCSHDQLTGNHFPVII